MSSDSQAADVQAELQQYLNSKNINSLFISIVENLLIEKPANPIGFIIEYLAKHFPDQSNETLEKIAGRMAPVTNIPMSTKSAVAATTTTKPSAQIPAKSPSSSRKAQEPESDDEDDYGDIPDPVQRATPSKPTGGNRRRSVSAESTDPEKLKSQIVQIRSFPKSREVMEDLLSVVQKSLMLRTLDSEQKELIVKAFSGPLEKKAGEDIIVQGDIGDEFYLLEDGVVDVYIKKRDTPEVRVHTYRHGDSFGELAIMYNTPRAATCRAQTDCKLWTLDRVSFKAIVVSAAMQKREAYQSFLHKVPILQSLSTLEIMTLADCLAEMKFSAGETICRQGDQGDYFYIIREGEAVCWQGDGSGTEGIVGELSQGNYFGEISLITSKPRQATVKAGTDLSVLAIDRATFTRVMGSMEDILKRNIADYIKYTGKSGKFSSG